MLLKLFESGFKLSPFPFWARSATLLRAVKQRPLENEGAGAIEAVIWVHTVCDKKSHHDDVYRLQRSIVHSSR